MSTTYYLYRLPEDSTTTEEELAKKQALGVNTWEKRPVFYWIMQPGKFLMLLMDCATLSYAVVDECGNKFTIQQFVNMLCRVQCSYYDLETADSLE